MKLARESWRQLLRSLAAYSDVELSATDCAFSGNDEGVLLVSNGNNFDDGLAILHGEGDAQRFPHPLA